MAGPKKKPTLADDLMESLLKEVQGDSASDSASDSSELPLNEIFEPLELNPDSFDKKSGGFTSHGAPEPNNSFLSSSDTTFDSKSSVDYESTRINAMPDDPGFLSLDESLLGSDNSAETNHIQAPVRSSPAPSRKPPAPVVKSLFDSDDVSPDVPGNLKSVVEDGNGDSASAGDHNTHFYTEDETLAINQKIPITEQANLDSTAVIKPPKYEFNSGDKTVAVTGFHKKPVEDYEDKIKVSIGQNKSASSQGYAAWGGNSSEASLGQADNLRIAQEKILELERENETLRQQNEELISASDIIKERSDLLTAQVNEYQNDKQDLEESFKNETALLKGHLQRKEVELQKAQLKIDDLDSRLKFDMKKIRIRERELENRLELIRAEKNALSKSKDDQILDLRRKMDVMQMEVESYRQKCVDLNKTLETNQDSFKRTTRALRLAMANLELQEESKPTLKKVD